MGGFSLLLHCSHLISIGRWLADMSLRLACLLIGGRRRRGRSRIGLFGSERWHTRQFRQIAVLPVSVLEFGFPTSGIRTHPLPFSIRQDRLFHMSACEFGAFFPQCYIQCSPQRNTTSAAPGYRDPLGEGSA